MQFKHIDTSGNLWGIVAANIQEFGIEDSTFHNSGEHGIYLTNHADVSGHVGTVDKNIFIRRSLVYSNGPNGNGVHINGRFQNVVMEQNVVRDNEVAGFGLQTGVSYSTVRSNLLINNGSGGIVINDYPDFCTSYDPTGPCPYDQNHNLIENNTIYETGTLPISGDAASGQVGLAIVNGGATSVDMGYTTIRNNIFVTNSVEGAGAGYPQIRYDESAYAATSTFQNNLFWSTYGTPGTYTNVIRTVVSGVFGNAADLCGRLRRRAAPPLRVSAGAQTPIRKFVAASPSYWNAPSSFNLRLQGSSPAVRTGASGGAPGYDVIGNPSRIRPRGERMGSRRAPPTPDYGPMRHQR